jgi:competence protein ComEC
MSVEPIPIWKKAPFLRYFVAISAGSLLQWYCALPVRLSIIAGVCGFTVFVALSLLSYRRRFALPAVRGITMMLLFFFCGCLLIWQKDVRHHVSWFGKNYQQGNSLIVRIDEPLVEKANSWKAEATVRAIKENGRWQSANGTVILYFEKNILPAAFAPGQEILFNNPLQEIKATGNPGSFDYKRYCLFHGITHQVYLRRKDISILRKENLPFLDRLLLTIRKKVVLSLRANIAGEEQVGLAEALLIGYKNDLDKDLVQSYSNTGVVHVIAISGLHLGLIYWLLLLILKPFKELRIFRRLIPWIAIAALWLFSLLAGGEPSVLRSALMFTCIVLAENFSRKSFIYNTLSVSAFSLVCIDPFCLWDVGFQLSYSAVLSIVVFYKPVYDLLFLNNKILDHLWKMAAVSIAAQILTTPFTIFHFHQFPNYFLITNLVAVPLSSLIVLLEIFVCSFSFLPALSLFAGKITARLIDIMNGFIIHAEHLPFSLWKNLNISLLQSMLMLLAAIGLYGLLKQRNRAGLRLILFSFLFFAICRSWSFFQANNQEAIIVYNVPHCSAIDLVDGRGHLFIGDSLIQYDKTIQNFHIQPAQILYRLRPATGVKSFSVSDQFISYGEKRILILNKPGLFDSCLQKIQIDLLIVSKTPTQTLKEICKTFYPKLVVLDASLSAAKLNNWENDCISIRVPCYIVSEQGAFVMKLN